jgi:hypothetical protein
MTTAELTKIGLVLANATDPADDLPLPGVYPGVPMLRYHRWPCASNSRLSKIRQSPAHLKAYLEQPTDSATFALGRATHAAILEPDVFSASYVLPERCTAIKKDKARCDNSGIVYAGGEWFCGVHGKGIASVANNVTVLPPADYRAALSMRDAVFAHPKAARLLSGKGEAELSALWQDETTGVMCKARLDRYSPIIAGGAIVDIKTTRNASPTAFERAIYEHGYHRQAAFYLQAAKATGLNAEHFVIVAVEKEPPFAVALYRVSEAAITAGEEQLKPLLALYGQCVASDTWPGYSENIEDIALPSYAWSQIEQETTAA